MVFHAGLALVLEICQKRMVKELDDLELISVKARLGQMVVKMPKLFGEHCAVWMCIVLELSFGHGLWWTRVAVQMCLSYDCNRVVRSDHTLWGIHTNM